MIYDKQKASMLRRIPAWILDIILLIILATGIFAAFEAILKPWSYTSELATIYDKYEAEYNTSFDYTQEEYEALTAEEQKNLELATKAFTQDEQAVQLYNQALSVIVLSVSLSLLFAYAILEFLIPLCLKNGQTVGKKIFGVALMRKDGVKVTPFMMFARSILGKYTIETMIPAMLIIGFFAGLGTGMLLIAVVFLLAQVIVGLVTKDKTGFHDMLACTVAVDLSSQMIFDSPEEQLEYHKRIHEEAAAKADY